MSSKVKEILVIEDDTEIREALVELLQLEGYKVQGVKNGQEGIAYLQHSSSPSLILLDLKMPVMNGWQFREAQMKDPSLAKIPVIILSADHEISEQAMATGVKDVLKKPVDLEHLLAVIKQYC